MTGAYEARVFQETDGHFTSNPVWRGSDAKTDTRMCSLSPHAQTMEAFDRAQCR